MDYGDASLFRALRPRRRINPPLLQRPAQRIPNHGIGTDRILHKPFLQLRPHIPDNLRITRKRRHLELHEARGIDVHTPRRLFQTVEVLLQRLFARGRFLDPASLENGTELSERDVDGYRDAAREPDDLERQVRRVRGDEAHEQRVHDGLDEDGEPRACDDVRLERAQHEQRHPAPVAAELKVAEQAQAVEASGRKPVVRDDLRLQAAPHVIAQRDAVAPARDVGAEALVGESLGRVRENVGRRLQVDEVVACVFTGG